ncbi:hypothetical protein SBA_ch2_5550 [Sphingomonas bisphenolicum]|uniref:Uncharacterized protein n=2 Tax=Sphingomonas bisphenolicum TaxID=296544 RepID=A0ABN5WLE0_9SPHN|nr:hypothetical protein SBA_ch2_5550 [Sphingomonas bisphenolicum]
MFNPNELTRTALVARDRSVDWLLKHIESDGRPADCDTRTGWSRLGWSLAVAGEPAAASAVVSWAAKHRIGENGDYLPGFMEGQSYISQYANYWLGTFVVSAWMAGSFDIALRSMDYLASQQDPVYGGLPTRLDSGNHPAGICDVLSTAQVGLSALITGQLDVADKVYRWLEGLLAAQPSDGNFYMFRQGEDVWRTPDPAFAWAAIVPFNQPRQAFYGPGMAAVFLARYAHIRHRLEAIELARGFLAYNVNGTQEQFTDIESVQACKFGWAVGVMHQADPEGGWGKWLAPMMQWFIDRQAPEGWWGPSRFADPNPTFADRLVKTSEHLMEITALISALNASSFVQGS